jgi:hypothetical protein
MVDLEQFAILFYQEHFFHDSNGQRAYIQDRLKRVRRSLPSDQQQRPRSQTSKESAAQNEADSKTAVYVLGEIIC